MQEVQEKSQLARFGSNADKNNLLNKKGTKESLKSGGPDPMAGVPMGELEHLIMVCLIIVARWSKLVVLTINSKLNAYSDFT
jgi:hypothetical protein